MGKKNISVNADFSESGKVTPKYIIWDDGRRFEIDRITDITKAASLKAGGIGLRYSCEISGKQRYLYLDDYEWYVEVD